MEELSKRLQEELKAIGMYQPVFSGDLLSKGDTQVLKKMGLVMGYEGDYVLTNLGKETFASLFPEEILGGKISSSYKKHTP